MWIGGAVECQSWHHSKICEDVYRGIGADTLQLVAVNFFWTGKGVLDLESPHK